MKRKNKIVKVGNNYSINDSSIYLDKSSLEDILKESGIKDIPKWLNQLDKLGENYFEDNYLDNKKLSFNKKLDWKKAFTDVEEEPDTETIPVEAPPEEEPTTYPERSPQPPEKPEKINPFRKPNIRPGTEPQPKAKTGKNLKKNAALRVHPRIKDLIDKGGTPYHALPTIPRQSFLKEISDQRFKHLINLLEKYSKTKINSVSDITYALFNLINTISSIESDYKYSLEDLAVTIVKHLYGIDDEIEFDAKLEGPTTAEDIPNIQSKQAPTLVSEEELQAPSGNLDLEVAKRRFVNGLIQGAGINSLHAFHLVKEELDAINPDLIDMYALFSIFVELQYWIDYSEGTLRLLGEGAGVPVAGKVRVDLSGDKPIIRAVGINFPTLVQELVKGVMELISMHGLPQDEQKRLETLNQADTLEDESWDIRFGPELWKKLLTLIEGELDGRALSVLYYKLVSMPSEEFHDFVSRLISNNPDAIRRWNEMYQESINQS